MAIKYATYCYHYHLYQYWKMVVIFFFFLIFYHIREGGLRPFASYFSAEKTKFWLITRGQNVKLSYLVSVIDVMLFSIFPQTKHAKVLEPFCKEIFDPLWFSIGRTIAWFDKWAF